jgi:hypothetical protein
MEANHSGGPTAEVSRFSVSTHAEVSIQIGQRDGRQVIIIQEQTPGDSDQTTEHTIEIPAAMLPELKRAVNAIEETFGDSDGETTRPGTSFAHISEERLARILDFYHITWQYEPRTFPIEWDQYGNVVSSFTPDFYLPDHDLYIELTTLKQPLVTKKNRKVRLVKQLYPEIRIKVLYAADYRKLIEKFAASGTWHANRG